MPTRKTVDHLRPMPATITILHPATQKTTIGPTSCPKTTTIHSVMMMPLTNKAKWEGSKHSQVARAGIGIRSSGSRSGNDNNIDHFSEHDYFFEKRACQDKHQFAALATRRYASTCTLSPSTPDLLSVFCTTLGLFINRGASTG
jgi:hypothetical protein